MKLAMRLAVLGALSAAMPASTLAQDAPKQDNPNPDTSKNPPPAPSPTPPDSSAASGVGQPGPAVPGSPDLTVATVKMEGGVRTSKMVGSAVFNGGNQQVGTVDDLIMNHDGHVVLGVISVGGFLGVGGKLVAVPFGALHVDGAGKITLPDASKDSLGKMPGFTYVQ